MQPKDAKAKNYFKVARTHRADCVIILLLDAHCIFAVPKWIESGLDAHSIRIRFNAH